MHEVITVLPESVANQIAAGEVIQRPASVLKELVENSLDAGARNIRIEIEDAGRSLIRVCDDGCGMSPMDARMAFERHATSKIHSADDLFRLTSMGFRGEALASIVSVAQVELVTRREEDETATKLIFDGSEIVAATEVAAPVGSTFTVRNLFFNVPARRRFLKSDRTEMNHLIDQLERIVLVNPDVAFSLFSEGKAVTTLPMGSLKKRIVDTKGKAFEKGLIPLDFKNEIASISGFIGTPETAKRKSAQQFMFVNNRFMKHPFFHKAICSVYEKLIPTGYKPCYFIYFAVNPSRIDVNIHPTKTEIKFLDERTIFKLLVMVTQQAISKVLRVPTLDFNAQNIVDIPSYREGETLSDAYTPEPITDPSYNPFIDPSGGASNLLHTSSNYSTRHRNMALPKSDWQDTFDQFLNSPSSAFSLPTERPIDSHTQSLFTEEEKLTSPSNLLSASGNNMLLYEGNFILTALSSGLALIHVQRAQERFMYDEILALLQRKGEGESSQQLLLPELIQLAPQESLFFEELLPTFEEFGFEISPLGGGGYSFLSVPRGLEDAAATILKETLKSTLEKEGDPHEELAKELALTYLEHHKNRLPAISSLEEAERLVGKLFSLTEGYYTPSGKPIFRLLSPAELTNLLG